MSEEKYFPQVRDLDHPCRQTCSGWEQGRERGRLDKVDELLDHKARIAELEEALEKVDQFLCEHIIDPYGYDPEKETRSELIDTVVGSSDAHEQMLSKIRQVL